MGVRRPCTCSAVAVFLLSHPRVPTALLLSPGQLEVAQSSVADSRMGCATTNGGFSVEPFGFRKIKLAVLKRAAGKFAGLRGPGQG